MVLKILRGELQRLYVGAHMRAVLISLLPVIALPAAADDWGTFVARGAGQKLTFSFLNTKGLIDEPRGGDQYRRTSVEIEIDEPDAGVIPANEQCTFEEWLSRKSVRFRFSCPAGGQFQLSGASYEGRLNRKVILKCVSGCPPVTYRTVEWEKGVWEE